MAPDRFLLDCSDASGPCRDRCTYPAIMSWDDPLAIHIMQEAMILTSLDQRRWVGSIRRLGGAAAPQLKTGKSAE